MKKIVSFISILSFFAIFVFAEVQKVEINLSKTVDAMVLRYNKWGIEDLSRWQSNEENVTSLFNDNLPQKGDMLNIIWKGTSDVDIKNLYIIIVDIDENNNWTHLLSDEKMRIPVAQNIKGGQEFEINATKILDSSPKTNVKIFLCCGEKDTDKMVNLTSSIPEGFERVTKPYNVRGVKLGSTKWQAEVSENIITWKKGFDNGNAGWNFSDIDLSAYERVRVEIESSNTSNSLRIAQGDWSNNHGFRKTGKNVYEAYLSGLNSSDSDLPPLEPAKGLIIYLDQWNNGEPRTEDKTTVVKSIKFFKPGEYDESGALSIYGHSFGGIEDDCEIQDNIITWKKGFDNGNAGWNLSDIDLSAYERVRVEIESSNTSNSLRIAQGDWSNNHGFEKTGKNVYEAYLSGSNSFDRDLPPLEPSKGLIICFDQWNNGEPRAEDKTTVVKSIKFFKPGEYDESGALSLLERSLGGIEDNCEIQDNIITWKKGTKEGNAGWNLSGINLSEYASVKITIEKTDVNLGGLYISDRNAQKWKRMIEVAPNTYELLLTGENSDSTEPPIDTSEGVQLRIQLYNNKPLKKNMKTIVKSIELSKDTEEINENLRIEGVEFSSSKRNAFVSDGGVIDWEWDKKEKYPFCGWNVKGIDLSDYKGIRIELESTDIPVEIGMIQNEGAVCHTFYDEKTPGVYEAMFDGSEYSAIWPEGSSWNTSNGIEEIQIRAKELSKKGLKTVVKSISLISKDEQEIQQPAQLVLKGAKLGSKKNHAWIDDDFSINWKKNSWNECGWRVEKLDGEVLEIKVSSSDVPLRLRIRTLDHKNGVSYIDDGSHIFTINLKTKKQINQKGDQKAPEWEETTKKVDYSQGAFITLEANGGVYKEGKKTVVEYIKVE